MYLTKPTPGRSPRVSVLVCEKSSGVKKATPMGSLIKSQHGDHHQTEKGDIELSRITLKSTLIFYGSLVNS